MSPSKPAAQGALRRQQDKAEELIAPLGPARLFSFVLACAVFATLCVWGGRSTGAFQALEMVLHDRLITLIAPAPAPPPIALVTVDEQDLRRFGWPLQDGILAEALARLEAAGALVIGVDLYRDLPVPPGSARFERLLVEHPNIYWVYHFSHGERDPGVAPPPVLADTPRIGFNDITPDPGGVVRRALLYQDDGERVGTAFSLRLAQALLAHEGILPVPGHDGHMRLGAAELVPLEADFGPYVGLDARGYQILLDYRTQSPLPSLSLAQLLDGPFDPGVLRGKVVLLGSTAVSGGDLFYTPFSWSHADYPRHIHGVKLHARITDQIVRMARGETPPITSVEFHWQCLWCLVWALFGGLIGVRFVGLHGALLATLGMAGPVLLAWVALTQGVWLPLLPPMLVVGLAFLFSSTLTVQRLRRQRDYLEQARGEALMLANTDMLTGIANRRAIMQQGEAELLRAQRYQRPLSLMMFDIDHFKRVNDTHGHGVGDEVIRRVARCAAQQLRSEDSLGRIGGEEFLVLLPECGRAAAAAVAERIRAAVAAEGFTASAGAFRVTSSFGVTQLRAEDHLEALIERADQALYAAKEGGRDRVDAL